MIKSHFVCIASLELAGIHGGQQTATTTNSNTSTVTDAGLVWNGQLGVQVDGKVNVGLNAAFAQSNASMCAADVGRIQGLDPQTKLSATLACYSRTPVATN